MPAVRYAPEFENLTAQPVPVVLEPGNTEGEGNLTPKPFISSKGNTLTYGVLLWPTATTSELGPTATDLQVVDEPKLEELVYLVPNPDADHL